MIYTKDLRKYKHFSKCQNQWHALLSESTYICCQFVCEGFQTTFIYFAQKTNSLQKNHFQITFCEHYKGELEKSVWVVILLQSSYLSAC